MNSHCVSRISLLLLLPNHHHLVSHSRTTLSLLFIRTKPTKIFSLKPPPARPFSTIATQYPLQYDLIVSRPAQSNPSFQPRRRIPHSKPINDSSDSELGFDDWVDMKLTSPSSETESLRPVIGEPDMDKSKRKYYNKRQKRMYGSDSEDERRRQEGEEFVELKPGVVKFRTLHKREEELYFHDAFAYPWEKDKHYEMVYKLEKKYVPDHCFDRAFLEPGQSNANENVERVIKNVGKSGEGKDEKGLVFFDEEKEKSAMNLKVDVSEKKEKEMFKFLKKVPNKDAPEPFLSTRATGLPPKWDSPGGTVVLVNKPKGEFLSAHTLFSVSGVKSCGDYCTN